GGGDTRDAAPPCCAGGRRQAGPRGEGRGGRVDRPVPAPRGGGRGPPAAHAVPVRVGGFGGAEGLGQYLIAERVDALVDATHPYAAVISANAADAAATTRVPLLALRRPPWVALAGDRWIE